MMSDHFFVYVILFDLDVFGIFSTREAAEESFAWQIARGGPARADCKVERLRVEGRPESVGDNA